MHLVHCLGRLRSRLKINADAILVGIRLLGFAARPPSPPPRKISRAFKVNADAIFVGNRLRGFVTTPLSPPSRQIAIAFGDKRG